MIVLKPHGVLKLGLFLAAALPLLGWACLAVQWSALAVVTRVALAVGSLGLAVVVLDALQRRYEIRLRTVRVRVLFRWRTYHLPDDVRITTDRHGRMVLAQPGTGARILAIPSGYNRLGELEKRYWCMRVFD